MEYRMRSLTETKNTVGGLGQEDTMSCRDMLHLKYFWGIQRGFSNKQSDIDAKRKSGWESEKIRGHAMELWKIPTDEETLRSILEKDSVIKGRRGWSACEQEGREELYGIFLLHQITQEWRNKVGETTKDRVVATDDRLWEIRLTASIFSIK